MFTKHELDLMYDLATARADRNKLISLPAKEYMALADKIRTTLSQRPKCQLLIPLDGVLNAITKAKAQADAG